MHEMGDWIGYFGPVILKYRLVAGLGAENVERRKAHQKPRTALPYIARTDV
jgi:hypothetical protein